MLLAGCKALPLTLLTMTTKIMPWVACSVVELSLLFKFCTEMVLFLEKDECISE